MSTTRNAYRLIAVICTSLILAGCLIIPIPSFENKVVSGENVADSQVRAMIYPGDNARDIKARLGIPAVDFGPGKIFVYQWGIKKGSIAWLLGGPGAATGGIEPWTEVNLFFIAFDTEGKVLKSGTAEFHAFDTIGEQVRDWLSSVGLSSQFSSANPEQPPGKQPMLFVYRPSTSPCSFPTYDSNIFKSSVAVDGIVVGDLAKGEYLSADITAGEHAVTIDPFPDYRHKSQNGSFFVQNVRSNSVPVNVVGNGAPYQPVYIETYLCTGNGKTKMHAKVRDSQYALSIIRKLSPAW